MGFLIVWAVGLQVRLFPVNGYVPLTEDFGNYLYYLVLPSLARQQHVHVADHPQ